MTPESKLLELDEGELLKLNLIAARSSFLAFLQFVWWMPQKLSIGRHTVETCELLTKAVFDYLDGKSTFLVINMPFRHGKSDMVSRAFPAWFLGVCSDRQPDVILTGYGANLVKEFSIACKRIINSPEYKLIFPDVNIDQNRDAKETWGLLGSTGTVNCTGLGGTLTGKGYHLGICDDYCKRRKEAFSMTFRDETWNSFSVDFLTRRAPVAITIVVATMWHPDDVTGRILKAMQVDPDFPVFRQIVFPARKEGPEGWEFLFPERYPPEWYRTQRAALGSNMAAALLDCNPVSIGTRMFKIGIEKILKMPTRQSLNVYILVDSANAKRKNNDYTTMWVVGLGSDQNYYVLDCIRDKLDLNERTDALFRIVERWKPSLVFWEQVGAMSDTQHVRYVQSQRGWHFAIRELHQSVAKDDRISWLIPVFESHRLWFPMRIMYTTVEGVTRDLMLDFETDEYGVYPAVVHDDMLDCLANLRHPSFIPITHFPTLAREGERQAAGQTADWQPW